MPNDFLIFAGDPLAGVLPQVDYLDPQTSPWRLGGFGAGTAISQHANKVWRQASIVASMIAQFVEEQSGVPSIDDGTITTLKDNFGLGILNYMRNQVSGFLPLTGGTLTGNLEIDSNDLIIRAPNADATMILDRVLGQPARLLSQSAGSLRWDTEFASADPETGNNLGSNWRIHRFNDAGVYVDTPVTISRQTGVVDFMYPPTIRNGNLPYVPITGNAYMTGPLGVGGTGLSHPGMGLWNNFAFGWNGNVNMYVDGTYVGDVATTGYVNSVAGAYLPLAGGQVNNWLGVNGSFDCYGSAGFHSSVFFSNIGDFANFYDGRTRYRQWAGNWWDGWDGATGNRTWYCAGGQRMFLDGVGNFDVTGQVVANGGRISSRGGWGTSVSAWDVPQGVATGFWSTDQGMWLGNTDGGGSPSAGHMLIENGGYTHIWGGFGLHGSANIDGTVSVGQTLTVWNNMAHVYGGYPMINLNNTSSWYYMGMVNDGITAMGYGLHWGQQDGGGNYWGYMLTLDSGGNLFARGGVYHGSDPSLKKNIIRAPEVDSLAAITSIPIVSYDVGEYADGMLHHEHGVLSTDIRKVLPDVVVADCDGVDHLDLMGLLVHAFRAIRQLNDKLERTVH